MRIADSLNPITISNFLRDPLLLSLLRDQLIAFFLIESQVDLLAGGHACGTSKDWLN